MPKTIRNEFDKKLTYENLMISHKLSQKGKRCKKEVIIFNLKQEEYIQWLYEQLKTGKYKHRGYRVFYIKVPKERKIEVSCYMDRIVHRWIVDFFLKEYFVKSFIDTSFACIENRGTHRAVLEVQETMRHCQRIWGGYYILKMDVAKYFQNIDKNILLEILERKIKDEKLMNLIKQILYSNDGEKGLPIGNYTSQTFANIYLNEVDQYVKQKLKYKYYFRYMDDSIILFKTKEEAIEALAKIRSFLDEKLKLVLNDKTQVIKDRQGVNFCGYKINENRIKIRDRGKRNLKLKLKKLKRKIKAGEMSSVEAYRFISGHIGYISIADVRNLTDKLFYLNEGKKEIRYE